MDPFVNPIRTVHVGVRGRGAWPVRLLSADPRFTPVALVGREPTALGDALATAGLRDDAAFASLDEALERVEADAVVVCTPVELHARDLRTAFAARKHVLVEKCLTNDWDEAVALVDEAEAAGVELVVAQNYRYTPCFWTFRHLAEAGSYGEPMLVDLALQKYRPAPRQQDYPFAVMWDQGCHHVDALQWALGPVVEVEARTFGAPWSRYRDDAALSAVFRFSSGAVWTYLVSNLARSFDHRFSVQTERGTLTWEAERWRWHEGLATVDDAWGRNAPPLDVANASGLPPSGEHGVVDRFAVAVAERVATGISGRENLETLRVCEMVRRAGTGRRAVSRTEV